MTVRHQPIEHQQARSGKSVRPVLLYRAVKSPGIPRRDYQSAGYPMLTCHPVAQQSSKDESATTDPAWLRTTSSI
jgi:hypothetical protein